MVAQVISPIRFDMPTEIDVELCYVKIVDICPKTHKNGFYKEIHVVQEIGFWLRRFCFNIFQNHALYNSLERQLRLFVKVNNHYSIVVRFDSLLKL